MGNKNKNYTPETKKPYMLHSLGGESCKDSASGNHSGDFVDFRATADRKSSSALKSTKSPTSNTANPRIHFLTLGVCCVFCFVFMDY